MHANDPVALNTDIKREEKRREKEKEKGGKKKREGIKKETKGKKKERRDKKKKENEANYYDEILPYKRVPYPKAG